jgi:hypothetical protein
MNTSFSHTLFSNNKVKLKYININLKSSYIIINFMIYYHNIYLYIIKYYFYYIFLSKKKSIINLIFKNQF